MKTLSLFKKFLIWAMVVIMVSTATVCAFILPGKYEYVFDYENENNFSYWTSMPFVTKEAKAQGYTGSEACQHLTSIERSEQNKNLMFFGTDASGVCRSSDGGKTWEQCNYGLFTSGVSMIEIDPRNDSHIVAINATSSQTISKYTALFVSYDCGNSWKKSDGTRGIGFSASHYYYDTLEIDPNSYDETKGYCTDVYFSTPVERDIFDSSIKNDEAYFAKRGLYKSTDGGESYSKIEGTDELADGIIVIKNNIIAVANMRGIYVLNGDSFTKKWTGDVHSLIYIVDKYYVLCEDGIYWSENLEEFTKLETENFPSADRLPRNLMISEKNTDYMMCYARKRATNKYSYRPYYSHDGGRTWTLAELKDSEELFYNYTYHAGIFTYDPDDENVIVGIIGGEVIKSSDGGQNFYYSGEGINNISLGGSFHFNVYDEDLVYIGALDFGGALTTDGGKTWENLSLSKDGDGRDIMAGYIADKNTIFGVYVDSWSPGDYFRDYRYVCFSHDRGKTVNIDPNVIKSEPDTYSPLNIDHSLATAHESSYQSPNNRKVLFCANYRSEDNGYTWTNMQDMPGEDKCLQVYTHYGKTLYGCSKQSGFVLKSDDDGRTWSKVNTTELTKWKASSPSHIVDIAVDGKNGYIYAAYGDKLFRMNMDGSDIKDLTKSMVKDNWNTFRVRSVDIDKNFPEIVYCCGSGDFYMSSDSVRRSCDSGESWKTMTVSSSSQSIVKTGAPLGTEGRCVRVRKNGEVWLGTLCLGFCKLTPPYKKVRK